MFVQSVYRSDGSLQRHKYDRRVPHLAAPLPQCGLIWILSGPSPKQQPSARLQRANQAQLLPINQIGGDISVTDKNGILDVTVFSFKR